MQSKAGVSRSVGVSVSPIITLVEFVQTGRRITKLFMLRLQRMYTVSGKKETNMFSAISPTKLGQLWRNLAHSFLDKFAATWCEHFPPHLNNVSTLPCETWNAHRARATIALLDKLQNLSLLNCGLQIRKIWIQLITVCGKYCKKVYKTCITDLELSTTPLMDGCHNDDVIQLVPLRSQLLFQFVQISDAYFLHLLLRYFSHSVINWIQMWRTWRPQLHWDKFWSFFLYQLSGIALLNEHFKFYKVV